MFSKLLSSYNLLKNRAISIKIIDKSNSRGKKTACETHSGEKKDTQGQSASGGAKVIE